MTVRELFVVGASGLGREVAWLAEGITTSDPETRWRLAGFADLTRGSVAGYPIITDDDLLSRSNPCAVAIGLGFPSQRRRLADLLEQREDFDFPALVHPSVNRLGPLQLRRGAGVTAGCSLTGDIELGEFSFLNLNVTVGHDVVIGRWCVVNPGANLSGGVTLGDGALVGTGAAVLQGIRIGADATVGAGAVVTRDVEQGATVVGVPARAI